MFQELQEPADPRTTALIDARQATVAASHSRTRAMLQDTSRLPIGDPAKMVKIIIDSVDQNPAPKRIVLGSDSYTIIHKALAERLAALEAQKSLALSTDFPAV